MALRVWLPLNGNLKNLGTSLINIINNNVTTNSSGKIGNCYYFNASSYLYENTYDWSNFNTSEFSFCCWYKQPSPVASGNSQIICIGTSSGWNNIRIGLLRRTSNGYPMFSVSNGSSAVQYNCTATTFSLDTWNHIACTYNAGLIQIYLNGILNQTYTTTITPILNSSQHLGIGAASNGAEKLTGYLNDVRIYDHCLSAAEVHEIAQGLVLHYKLDKIMYGNNNLLANSKLDDSWTYPASSYSDKYSPTTTIVPTGTQYTLSFDAKSTVNGDKIRTHYYSPNTTTTCISSQGTTKTASDGNMDFTLSTEWKKYWVVYTQTSTTAVKHIICPRIVSGQGTGTVSVKNVKLEEGTIPTAWCLPNEGSNAIEDSSGYGNNGVIVGDLIQNSETKRYSISTKWNCSSPTDNSETGICYIQTPFSLTTPLQMSITWWAKPESGYGGSTNHAAFCTSNNTSRPTDYNTTAFHHRDAGFDIYPSDGSGVKRLSFTYTQNAWHHYAITYDGSTAKAYQDGVLKTNVAVGTNKTLASFSQLYIGYSQAGGARRKTLGSYSDFRIYCTALSADDVLQLYHTSAKVDNKQNLHAFELVESNSKISINKQGQTLCNELTEDTSTKFYKTNQIIETNEIIEL